MRNTNKKLNRNKKLLSEAIVAGTLLTVGVSSLVYTNKVDAKSLPVATTKDYNKLQKLAKQPGAHYIKTRKWYTSFMPGENVQAAVYYGNYKLIGAQSNPGIRDWITYVGSGTFNGKQYFIGKDENGKFLMPAEYCQVPYAYKLKANHKPVHDYLGSLANAYNGYNTFLDNYGAAFTKENTIYSNKANATYTVTLDEDGQNKGKYQGFWIGKTPINFRIYGTDTYEDYYPLYNYNPTGELTISYIKVEDLDQFEPATVKYDHIGTITNKHAFKPVNKKMNF